MKYRIIILFIVALFTEQLMSQSLVDKSADTGLMVRQIPNSESDAVKFFFEIAD